MLAFFTIWVMCPAVYGLIGFDCGGPYINATTISLLDAGECNLETKTISSEPTHLQLLQLADFDFTKIIQCRVSVARLIFYCGMHSHISLVHNGYAEYLRDVPYPQCQRMHIDGILSLGNNVIIEGLKINTTTTRSVTLAGSTSTDGKCTGTTYSDPYESWNDVIVQATLKITLRSGTAPVKINSGKLALRTGTTCNLADSFCIDLEDGHTFWNDLPHGSCNFKQYDVLYEGIAQRIRNGETTNAPAVYTLTTQDITFALTRTTETRFCGYTLLRTEHPKLFILEAKPGNSFAQTKPVAVENLDIFAYVNSKFIYVEKHLRTQMTTLYNDVMAQKCELERQVITNALSSAHIQPEEFAYTIMKGPGYMAVTAGEVVHIVKCIPVEVGLRPVTTCYNELPVTFRNTSYFVTPKSHILQKIGTSRECNRILPVQYQVDDTWVRFLPKPIDAPSPAVLRPHTKLTWTYLTPGKLATSGIYSEKDIESLREHIMFPAEKPAMINNMVQGMSGKQPLEDGMSVYNLFDEKTLNKIAENTAQKIWSGFVTFGSASAGLLGIFIIIRLAKLLIDTLIHGYALHSVYRCGIHLLGAIWSSVTHLLLHLARPPASRRSRPRNAEAAISTIAFHSAEVRPPIAMPHGSETRQPSAPLTNNEVQQPLLKAERSFPTPQKPEARPPVAPRTNEEIRQSEPMIKPRIDSYKQLDERLCSCED